jgi:molybdenum cofactor biosynthesis enzyme MoaA
MLTTRCNLCCRYCFRDYTKQTIAAELSVDSIKKVVAKLYRDFGVRKLTLSGGEPTFIKNDNCQSFIELMDDLRQYKHDNKEDNLRIVLITNAVLLTEKAIRHMVGVVDRITITIDALDEDVLTSLGRNTPKYNSYVERSFNRIKFLSDMGFEIKLHSVVTPLNYDSLVELAKYISVRNDIRIIKWKLFQYMGFGNTVADEEFRIDETKYWALKSKLEEILFSCNTKVSFKSIDDQEQSLFDLLPDGTFEYLSTQNGQKQRHHSKPVFEYDSWEKLLADCPIDENMFRRLHVYNPQGN